MSHEYLRFLEDNGPHFTSIAHIRGAFQDCISLSRLLIEAISNASRKPDSTVKLRAFESFSLNYELTNRIVKTPPTPGYPDAPTWLRRMGGAETCVAINELAQWNLPLAVWYIDRIRELIDVGSHIGSEPLDTYTFISAGTGWTPFGIHNDYEPSFIYHLGPGTKNAWIWPAGEPKGAVFSASPALNGVSFAIADNIASAQKYVLHPGDFCCIPAKFYHIFENTEPSAFLGITVFPRSSTRIFERLILSTEHRTRDDEEIEIRSAIDRSARDLAGRLSNIVGEFTQSVRRSRSCGFTTKPHQAALQKLPDPDFERGFTPRFRGVFQPAAHASETYVFGRKCNTGIQIDAGMLCEELNSMNCTSTAEFAAKLSASPEEIATMLTKFYLLGALQQ